MKILTLKCPVCNKVFQRYPSNIRGLAVPCCSVRCSVKLGTHGPQGHGDSYTRLYQIWSDMKQRCNNKNQESYKYYGARGIKICIYWQASYYLFKKWALANGYKKDLTLDRQDVNGDYSPDNCRWVTAVEQMRNTRKRANAQTSKYKGVSWCSNVCKWRAQISGASCKQHIGLYEEEIDAAKAYDEVAAKEFGQFAKLNFSRKEGVPF